MNRAEGLVKFLGASPTPYHAVNNLVQKLNGEGFKELKLNNKWDISLGGKYYLNLNGSMLMAFGVGNKFDKTNSGCTMIATHTDSPCFKLKPNAISRKDGFNLLGVQLYGGGIWHTWIDRDLTLAGIVYHTDNINSTLESKLNNIDVNNGSNNNFNKSILKSKLIHIKKPIARIPELAIHLNRKINEGINNNLETFYVPFISLSDNISNQPNPTKSFISQISDIKPEHILGFDLRLVDHQLPEIGGIDNEFIFSPRLDNLFNVYCSSEAFFESFKSVPLENDNYLRMILCYDDEEVGSGSYQGAGSHAIPNIIKRISECLNCDYFTLISNSLIISADQAHATHPNVPGKHESMHNICMDKGVVLKENANQRYATSAFTTSILEIVAQRHSLPIQRFVIRNDMSCGSTVGPILAQVMGIQVVDVGFPMLSMHSIRETCASISASQAIDFFAACFKEIPSILKSVSEN